MHSPGSSPDLATDKEYQLLLAALSPYVRAIAIGDEARSDPFSTACALAQGCRASGLDFEQYMTLAEPAPIDAGSDGRRAREQRRTDRLEKAWHLTAESFSPAVHSADEVRHQLAELSGRIDDAQFRGRSSSTDKRVAQALVTWAHEVGTFTLDANVRELGVRSGVSPATAARALKRLTTTGLIEPVTEPARPFEHAHRFRIHFAWRRAWGQAGKIGPKDVTETYDDNPPGEQIICITNVLHPVYLPKALGLTAGRVAQALPTDSALTARAVGVRTGLTERTARAALERLVSHGLAAKTPARPAGYRLLNVDTSVLDGIAAEYGTADWYDVQAQRASAARSAYAVVQQQRG